jgi:hypothetical protein
MRLLVRRVHHRGSIAPDPDVLKPLGDAWKKVEKTKFAVAVPMDDWGQLLVAETFRPRLLPDG